MAVNTWNGSTSTDFATAANWTTTGETDRVPTAADDVIIPDTSSINKCVLDQARNINSFVLAPDGELDQGNAFYIKGKNAAGEAVKCQGKLGDVSDFVVETQSAATVTLTKQSGSGSFRNLTITHASGDITLGAAASLSGNLTVTAGILNTSSSNYALTVAGDMLVAAGGTFTGNSSAAIMRSLELQGAATFSAPDASGSCTINGRKNGTSRCIDVGNNDNNFSGNGGTLTFTSANGGDLQGVEHLSAADELNNLTINVSDGSGTFYLMGDTTVTGNLTITAGTLTTNNGSADKNLTVTGATDVTGTLTLNDSTVSLGALRANSGAAITQGSSGTLELTSATAANAAGFGDNYSFRNLDGTSDINFGGTITISAANYFEPRTAPDYASVINNVVWNDNHYWVGKMTFGGTLVVNASKHMQTYNGSKDCIVTGDVTINGQLTALGNNVSAMTFGSLMIASGGTYNATSGTTTITNVHSSGYAYQNLGTMTHNKGRFKFTDNGHIYVQESLFYDLECALDTSSLEFRWSDTGGSLGTILGDLIMTSGRFKFSTAGDSIIVHGNTSMTSSAQFGIGSPSGTHTFHGLVTIKGGTWHLSSGTNNMAGIRNIGGTIS